MIITIGIIWLIIGLIQDHRIEKLEKEVEFEEDKDIKQALSKSIRKRKIIAYITIAGGLFFIICSIIIIIYTYNVL